MRHWRLIGSIVVLLLSWSAAAHAQQSLFGPDYRAAVWLKVGLTSEGLALFGLSGDHIPGTVGVEISPGSRLGLVRVFAGLKDGLPLVPETCSYFVGASAVAVAAFGQRQPQRGGTQSIPIDLDNLMHALLLAGVVKARETGVGMDVDTSLFDVAMHNLNYPGTWYLNGGTVTGRTARSGHPSLVPSQLYRTEDGWLFIMCNKEKFWPLLARALGHPEWITDPELVDFKARLQHRDRVTRLLDDVLKYQTVLVRKDVNLGALEVNVENVKFEAVEPPTEDEPEESIERQLGLVADPDRDRHRDSRGDRDADDFGDVDGSSPDDEDAE